MKRHALFGQDMPTFSIASLASNLLDALRRILGGIVARPVPVPIRVRIDRV